MRLKSLFITVALVSLAFAGRAAVARDAPRTFRDLVGVNVKFSQGQPQTDLPLLSDLGVRWVRDTVDWPTLEPAAGDFGPFPDAFGERLDFYKAHGIGVVFGLWYDNPAAYPADPTDPAAYGRHAARVARRLEASGTRFVIELYNEPHNTLKHLGGTWNGAPPAAWLDRYVEMVRAAVRDVKAADPDAKLLAGDDMWVVDYWLLEKGLPRDLDALTIHPYVKSWPESAAVEQDTTWAKPFTLVDADASFRSGVRRLRERADVKLSRVPAIWITEWGWPLGEEIHYRPMTEELLAALLPRAYLAAFDGGVETLCWFSLRDSVDGPMGLTDNDGKKRLPYTAMKVMVEQLGGATEIEHAFGETSPTHGPQAYRLTDADGLDKLVVFDIDGDSTAALDGQGAASVTAVDVFGRAVEIARDGDGRPLLKLGRSPLYLSGVAAGATLRPDVPPTTRPTYLFP